MCKALLVTTCITASVLPVLMSEASRVLENKWGRKFTFPTGSCEFSTEKFSNSLLIF